MYHFHIAIHHLLLRLFCIHSVTAGQLGTGVTPSGYLQSAYSPVLIPGFMRAGDSSANGSSVNHSHVFSPQPSSSSSSLSSKPSSSSPIPVRIKSIAAGSFHSVAVDEWEGVWTWGARGGACLGQGIDDLSSSSKRISNDRGVDVDGEKTKKNSTSDSYSSTSASFWSEKLPGIFPIHTPLRKVLLFVNIIVVIALHFLTSDNCLAKTTLVNIDVYSYHCHYHHYYHHHHNEPYPPLLIICCIGR